MISNKLKKGKKSGYQIALDPSDLEQVYLALHDRLLQIEHTFYKESISLYDMMKCLDIAERINSLMDLLEPYISNDVVLHVRGVTFDDI